ncbi:hypothetical protein AYO41_04260 [Verrucomicrobia bacterium SCGC AG-212-E04]|nr:hypothetical protein AYO41_04260 [Verrucomicrobia bacterium SCGC AG-212-E04]
MTGMPKRLVALLVLLLAPAARADILPCSPAVIWLGGNGTAPWDVNGDGIVDFTISCSFIGPPDLPPDLLQWLGVSIMPVGTNSINKVYLPGSSVGPGSLLLHPGAGCSFGDESAFIYLIFSFTTASGQVDYGYETAGNSGYSGFIRGGYFESSGGPITVGVPEPSTYALVALGLVALVGWRIRRA